MKVFGKILTSAIASIIFCQCNFSESGTTAPKEQAEDITIYNPKKLSVKILNIDSELVIRDTVSYARFVGLFADYSSDIYDTSWNNSGSLDIIEIRDRIYNSLDPVILLLSGINGPDEVTVDTLEYKLGVFNPSITLFGYATGPGGIAKLTLNDIEIPFHHYWWEAQIEGFAKGKNLLIAKVWDFNNSVALDTVIVTYE